MKIPYYKLLLFVLLIIGCEELLDTIEPDVSDMSETEKMLEFEN